LGREGIGIGLPALGQNLAIGVVGGLLFGIGKCGVSIAPLIGEVVCP
jgi:hypothetical protein